MSDDAPTKEQQAKTPAAGGSQAGGDTADSDGPRALVSPYRQALVDAATATGDDGDDGEKNKATAAKRRPAANGHDKTAAADDGEGEGDTETGETDTETGEADTETGEGAGEAGGAEAIGTLTELVAAQEWDPDWVDGLKVNVKVNGEHSQATLKQLVDSYQTQEAANARLEKAKAQAAEREARDKERGKLVEQAYHQAVALIQAVEKDLTDDIANADLQQLRRDDPAEYAARLADFEKRRQRVENLKAEALTSWQKGQEELRAAGSKDMGERIAKEVAALVKKIPEWGDKEKAKAGLSRLTDYLVGEGFARDDIAQTADHRLFVMAEKARRFDEITRKSDAAVKKVTKAAKVMKPGPKGGDQQRQKDPSKMTMAEYREYRNKQGANFR